MQHIFSAEIYEIRLRSLIEDIIIEREEGDRPLTWRALGEIEDEALRQLEEQHDLSPELCQLFIDSCRMMSHPRTDEPVTFGNSSGLSISASAIVELHLEVYS